MFQVLHEQDASSTAIVNQSTGAVFSYGSLLRDIARARQALLKSVGDKPLTGERIGFLVENGYGYVGKKATSTAFTVIQGTIAKQDR